MFIPIESTNVFRLGNVNDLNVTFNYSITNAVLNCSSSYSGTEFFHGLEIRNKIAGASCIITAPIMSSMNLTVSGSAAINYTWTSYSYEGHSDCIGYIFINVTMPEP